MKVWNMKRKEKVKCKVVVRVVGGRERGGLLEL
jgi:hypothetical protein